jgi:hypothetical protein
MVIEYAKLFSLDPEDVYQKPFIDVVSILASERRTAEFRLRYHAIEIELNKK